MTNEQVIKAYLKGEKGQATSLSSDGSKLKSYATVVSRHLGKNMVCITMHKYSPTTTAQVNMLARIVKAKGMDITWVDHEFLNDTTAKAFERVPRKGVSY